MKSKCISLPLRLVVHAQDPHKISKPAKSQIKGVHKISPLKAAAAAAAAAVVFLMHNKSARSKL